jgi:hypothetical protein
MAAPGGAAGLQARSFLAETLLGLPAPSRRDAAVSRDVASQRDAAPGIVLPVWIRGAMDGKLRIRILDDCIEVPAGDSILRALQVYAVARRLPTYGFGRFCWNGKCQQCILQFTCDGVRDRDFACQTEVRDDMQVNTLPDVLRWKHKINSSR